MQLTYTTPIKVTGEVMANNEILCYEGLGIGMLLSVDDTQIIESKQFKRLMKEFEFQVR